VESFLKEMDEACSTGVDILEIRLDFIKDFDTERDLKRIMSHSKLPYLITYRPKWEW
jgi:3-dehydroquinate dehydratase